VSSEGRRKKEEGRMKKEERDEGREDERNDWLVCNVSE
jgi:hypothetical protein